MLFGYGTGAPGSLPSFLLLPVVYDLISLHRVHWVTMFAVPFVWVLLRLEIPLGRTHVWHSAVDLMLRLLHF